MFCGKCGKKIHEDMLFCPFCGTAVVIPDQEENPVPAPDEQRVDSFDDYPNEEYDDGAPEMNRGQQISLSKAKRERISLFDDSAFADDDTDEDEQWAQSAGMDPADPYGDGMDEPQKPEKKVLSHPEAQKTNVHRGSNTYIPVRTTKPEDMFLGTEEDDDYDEYDDDEDEYDEGYDDVADDDYDFEDEPRGSFFGRHKGILITMAVLLVLVIGSSVFICAAPGQKLLAKVNLAWKASAYAELGKTEYDSKNYAQAAADYVKAFAKDDTNYEYAHSAMVCYYEAKDIGNAAEMAIRCIEMRPDESEPYRELMTIYGSSELPARVRNYIQQGYSRTGDEYLNLKNWGSAA